MRDGQRKCITIDGGTEIVVNLPGMWVVWSWTVPRREGAFILWAAFPYRQDAEEWAREAKALRKVCGEVYVGQADALLRPLTRPVRHDEIGPPVVGVPTRLFGGN